MNISCEDIKAINIQDELMVILPFNDKIINHLAIYPKSEI